MGTSSSSVGASQHGTVPTRDAEAHRYGHVMSRRGEMQEVELLDAGDALDNADPSPGVGSAPDPSGRPRVGRRRLAAAAVVVAVTLGVVQWVAAAREGAALTRLSHVAGVLSPIDGGLTVLQRVPAADAAELFGGGRGARLTRGTDGSQSLTWDDPAGGPGWTTALLGPSSALAGAQHVFGGTTCQADNEPATDLRTAHRVVCLVTDGGTAITSTGEAGDTVVATIRQVVVLSTADGTVESRWPLERGQSLALTANLAVIGTMTADSGVVTGYDLLTGDERWTHEARLLTETGYAEGGLGMGLFRAGDLIAYSTPAGRLTLLSASGEVVRDDLGYQGDVGSSWTADPATGALVVESHTRDGKSHSTFVAADGNPAGDLKVDGEPVWAAVDDGSVPGLMLTYDTALHAWDAATRAARWSHDAYQTTSAVIVRGYVYAATARGLVALDGKTGELVWRREGADSVMPGSVSTDGRHVFLTPNPGGTGATPVLIAYDPTTGEEAFRAPYPVGIVPVGEANKKLLGFDAAKNEYVQLG
jgi:hypothetical protein